MSTAQLTRTTSARWLRGFLHLYDESTLAELVAYVSSTSAPDVRVEESDLRPVATPAPHLGDWVAPLVYLNRGLKVEVVHEETNARICVTARERLPVVTGRVRLTVTVDPLTGQLQRFHMASVHDGHRFVTVPVRPAARTSVWAAARNYLDTVGNLDVFSGCVLVQGPAEPLLDMCLGEAHQATGAMITSRTRFNLASITKAFTAVAALRLAQEGRFDVHDEVNAFLPQPVNAWRGVTPHQLLTHTAGFDPAVLTGDLHWLWKDRCRDMAAWWHLVRFREPDAARRGGWHYSNVGYVILGLAIQHAAEEDYYTYVKRVVFDAAGMDGADFDELDFEHPERAMGYEVHASKPDLPARPRRSHVREVEIRGGPHGYAYSTAADLVRFIRALRGGQLLDEERTRLMLESVVPTNRPDSQAGYGLFHVHADERALLHVSGAGAGISAWLDHDLERDTTTVVLSNYAPPAAHRVGRELRSLLARA
ncbi:CubicO group peptidase (beta-lactamase class C family) [Deinococcus yavapaiensis KR-236]|uniref:CubicO group peptidase (Beta-lactamase class C family) n=1 Tax=Deinococcus yavapaiensis KR-236 TaxID=694435 RepID=A0A318SB67_9DEIO|nr:CubicO group peptidase (beta-lactamase class C family) [Deinococcus yavapaiensis KR-236]